MDSSSLDALFKACHSLPKIELHAHLNGCIRGTTLLELAAERGVDTAKIETFERSNQQCMAYFSIAHQTIDSLQCLRRIVLEMVDDYAKQNTIYLEIRTTIKRLKKGDVEVANKQQYFETVLKAIKEAEQASGIIVRLIASIDRSRGMAQAENTLELCKKFDKTEWTHYLVGLQFSGNPVISNFGQYLSVFENARESGFKIAVHTSQLRGQEIEAEIILGFKPNRLGHCTHMTPDQLDKAVSLEIPVQVCPTSNTNTFKINSDYKQLRHFQHLWSKQGKIAICADDTGLFGINHSTEFFEIGRAFNLSPTDLAELELSAAEAIFDPDPELKDKLKAEVMKFKASFS